VLRWGVALILFGIVLYLFGFAGGGDVIDIGKWIVLAALVIWVLGGVFWPRGTGTGYNPGPPL
jgi:hypothetical protein